MSLCFEFGPQRAMIVDLAVVDEDALAVGAVHGLPAGIRQIDDGEPQCPDGDRARQFALGKDRSALGIRP